LLDVLQWIHTRYVLKCVLLKLDFTAMSGAQDVTRCEDADSSQTSRPCWSLGAGVKRGNSRRVSISDTWGRSDEDCPVFKGRSPLRPGGLWSTSATTVLAAPVTLTASMGLLMMLVLALPVVLLALVLRRGLMRDLIRQNLNNALSPATSSR